MQSQDEGHGYPTERGKNKNAWRMDIGQTPIQGQRHGYAILLQMGVRGVRNERGNKGEDAQNDEKVQISL